MCLFVHALSLDEEFLLCRIGAGRSYLIDNPSHAESRKHGPEFATLMWKGRSGAVSAVLQGDLGFASRV